MVPLIPNFTFPSQPSSFPLNLPVSLAIFPFPSLLFPFPTFPLLYFSPSLLFPSLLFISFPPCPLPSLPFPLPHLSLLFCCYPSPFTFLFSPFPFLSPFPFFPSFLFLFPSLPLLLGHLGGKNFIHP